MEIDGLSINYSDYAKPNLELSEFLFEGLTKSDVLAREEQDNIVAVVLTVVYSTLAIAGFLANVLFCFIIWRSEKLHTVTHMLMTNLAVSNILFITFQPSYLITTNLLQKEWILGTVVCKISFSITYVTSTASFYFMCLVAIDRWLAIFKRKYRLNKKTCMWLTMAAWAISFMVAAPYIYESGVVDQYAVNDLMRQHDYFKVNKSGDASAPTTEFPFDVAALTKELHIDVSALPEEFLGTSWNRCQGATNLKHIWLIVCCVIQYGIPLAIMIPTYGHLAHFVWRRAPVGVQSKEKTRKAYRRRRKLLITLFAIVVFLIICWLPFFLVNILQSLDVISENQYTRLYVSSALVIQLGVLLTPICYLINDGCRQQVLLLFSFLRTRSSISNERERQSLMTTAPINGDATCTFQMYTSSSSPQHLILIAQSRRESLMNAPSPVTKENYVLLDGR